MKKVALIDADIITYLSAYHSMTKFDDGEVWVDMEAAKKDAATTIAEWTDGAECEEALLVFSPQDRTNYRSIIWPEYKKHRKPSAKPPHLGDVAEFLLGAYESTWTPYLEGDDVIGILHTQDPESTVMVSTDKDMKTIPGFLYNPNKNFGMGPVEISEAEAQAWLYTQVLTGDSTDGYKGVLKCGPVKAKKILDQHSGCALVKGVPTYYTNEHELHEATLRAYLLAGQQPEEFATNFAMARILQDKWFDAAEGVVTLPGVNYTDERFLSLPTN